MIANYHTHTLFSDGSSHPETYIDSAISKQMSAIGFSDHAPLPYANNFTMATERLRDYAQEIDELALAENQFIRVWKGLEIDYIPDVIYPGHDEFAGLGLDYTIGAVHYVDFHDDGRPWNVDGSTPGFEKGLREIWNGDICAAVERYYQLQCDLIYDHQPTILAHMDRIKRHNYKQHFFSERKAWYLDAVERVLQALSDTGTILEVNTKGHYSHGEPEFYPGRTILQMAYEMDIPVHPAADAHHPQYINQSFEDVVELLAEIGYTEIHQFDGSRWRPEEIALVSA